VARDESDTLTRQEKARVRGRASERETEPASKRASDGEPGVVLVCGGGRSRRKRRSRPRGSRRTKWERDEKRGKIKTYKPAAAADSGVMERSSGAESGSRDGSRPSTCFRLGLEWDDSE
jgi:hypothetical protein